MLALVAALGLAFALPSSVPAPRPAWNVVLVLVDTLRADHMGLYGYSRPTTPELDRFARQALVFDRAYSQSACTFPTVNALLTSAPVARFFRQPRGSMGIPPGVPTLALRLREAGYATAAVSTSEIVRATPSRVNPVGGFDPGFDSFDETCQLQPAACVNAVARARLQGLREPFFLYLHYLDPHAPYAPPARAPRHFAGPPEGLRDFARAGDPRPVASLPAADRRAFLRPGELRQLLDLYDDEIAYVDAQLGQLFAEIESRGLLGRTVVVVTADHGESFLDHDEMTHCQSVYDAQTRTPLLIRLPGGPAGRTETIAQTVDVMPTLLDVLGLARPGAPLLGRSLRPGFTRALRGGHVFSMQGPWRSANDGQRKLITDLRSGRARLFDPARDPHEQHDLSQAEPERLTQLRAALKAWLQRTEPGTDGLALSEAVQEELRALGYIQ